MQQQLEEGPYRSVGGTSSATAFDECCQDAFRASGFGSRFSDLLLRHQAGRDEEQHVHCVVQSPGSLFAPFEWAGQLQGL